MKFSDTIALVVFETVANRLIENRGFVAAC